MREFGSKARPEGHDTAAEEGTSEPATSSNSSELDQGSPADKVKKSSELMLDEERETGSVPWGVYGTYLRAAFSLPGLLLVVSLLLLSQGAQVATTLWLGFWSANRFPAIGQGGYMGVYAGIGAAVGLLEVNPKSVLAHWDA